MKWYDDPAQIAPMLATLEGLRVVHQARQAAGLPPELGGRGERLRPLVFYGTLECTTIGGIHAIPEGLLPPEEQASLPAACHAHDYRGRVTDKGRKPPSGGWRRGGIYELPQPRQKCIECSNGWQLPNIHDVHVQPTPQRLNLWTHAGRSLGAFEKLLREDTIGVAHLDKEEGRYLIHRTDGSVLETDENHVISDTDCWIECILHHAYHGACLRAMRERYENNSQEQHLAQVRMEMEHAGFTEIRLRPADRPERCYRELERLYAGKEDGDPMVLRAIPYAQADTAQGKIGLLLSEDGPCWIDLQPSGRTMRDLIALESGISDDDSLLLPLDPHGELFCLLYDAFMPGG